MKSVFIIALVAVGMIGVMVPSVFADHEELAIGTVDPSGSSEGYFPQYVQLSRNGLVTMINNDPTEVHTFTSGTFVHQTSMDINIRMTTEEILEDGIYPNGIFDSGPLSYGDTFEWIPTHSGQYPYYCKIHSWMVGNIVVLDYHPNPVIWQEGSKFDLHGTFTVDELKNEELAISNRYTSEFGFSFLPPKGASAEYFSDSIDSKVIHEHTFQPIVLYSYPDMDYDYVEPLMAVAAQKLPSEYIPQFSTLSNQQVVDFIINEMNKIGISGKIVSPDFERIDNGIYAKMGVDSEMTVSEYVIPIKYNFHTWIYENGLNVWVILSAEPQAYESSLVKFNELIDSVDFVDIAGGGKWESGNPLPVNLPSESIVDDSICGSGTIMKNGKCEIDEKEGGGCLIATATYGSELAPQVQQLRELRDNQLLQTESGTAFMRAFNDVYYSFSPTIADMEREHPMFKEAVKIAITPMISSLSLMENANSESEVLSIGISVIALNLGMYLGIPAIVIVGIKKKF